MKLLLLASVPPPHHGQSWMVELLVGGLSRSGRIGCFHIDSRFSDATGEIGRFSFKKLLRLVGYCFKAVVWRFRHGIDTLYYVPAPGRRTPFYRDLLVMALCRPFFRHIVLHWHARGLGEWLESEASTAERFFARHLLGGVALSVVLSEDNRQDAAVLLPRKIAVIPNGIPDPCPDYVASLLPQRRSRKPWSLGAAGSSPARFNLLFLGLCHQDKGLFDAIEAVGMANRRLASAGHPQRFTLTVAGAFPDAETRDRFDKAILGPGLNDAADSSTVRYAGFVSGPEKDRLYRTHDTLLFPTFYPAESFGLVVVEAMAYGMPVVTTRWRAVPGLLPLGRAESNAVEIHNPDALSRVLIDEAQREHDTTWRDHFESGFRLDVFIERVEAALAGLDSGR